MLVIDFLLLSVIVLCAYLGPMVLRRMGPGQRMYGWMIIADLALAIVAVASRRSEGPNATADLIGTIAIGGAVCLVFVPPVLRSLARRALVADRLRLARWLVNAREHLQPGMGARQESELISTIIEVRSGQVDAAIERLRERRDLVAEPAARRPIDERIIMTYLYARRWEDAIGWLEQNLEPGSASPQLAVELVRAYCELDRLDEAALLVERIEGVQSAAEEPIWMLLVSRARLVFLAFLGRISAVEAILGPRGPLGSMPDAARFFWYGLVRLKAGDRSGARSSLEKAAQLSGRDGRARELAQHTLSRIDEPGVAGPLDVSPVVRELADRLSRLAEDAPAELPQAEKTRAPRRTRPPRLSGVALKEIPVTVGLMAANLLVALAVFLRWGTTSDIGALIQAGANVKAAVEHGELWRLASYMFLHVGLLHLGINVYGLWVLGRLLEQMVGSLRFFVIYVGSGLAGGVASALVGGSATSVGASGAVFGLLAAAVVELAIHRKAYPRRWSGALLGMLLFLGAANIAIGFLYQVIDQSCHLGGLAGGALLGIALSRKHRFARRRWMQPIAVGLAVACGGAIAWGGFRAATSDIAQTIASYPKATRHLGGVTIEAPAPWQPEGPVELYDESMVLVVRLFQPDKPVLSAQGVLDEVEEWREIERKEGAKKLLGLEGAHTVEDRLLSVPAPWVSRELEVRTEDGVLGEQRIRVAIIGRASGSHLWLGSIYYPASLADAIAPAVAEMLKSAR